MLSVAVRFFGSSLPIAIAGGASVDFACHAAALSTNSEINSLVGRNDLDEQALTELHDLHVETPGIAT